MTWLETDGHCQPRPRSRPAALSRSPVRRAPRRRSSSVPISANRSWQCCSVRSASFANAAIAKIEFAGRPRKQRPPACLEARQLRHDRAAPLDQPRHVPGGRRARRPDRSARKSRASRRASRRSRWIRAADSSPGSRATSPPRWKPAGSSDTGCPTGRLPWRRRARWRGGERYHGERRSDATDCSLCT